MFSRFRRSAGLVAVAALALVAGCGTLLDVTPDPDPLARDGAAGDALVEVTDGSTDSAATGDAAIDGALPPVDAGHDGAEAGCAGRVACERVVFVTSATFTATDVATADAKCTALAATSANARINGGRAFIAWTSKPPPPMVIGSTAVSAVIVHGTSPYVRGDGTVIATDYGDLTNGDLVNGITMTELGTSIDGTQKVWTGTGTNGSVYMDSDCLGWSTTLMSAKAMTGRPDSVDVGWTTFDAQNCSGTAHLYCIER